MNILKTFRLLPNPFQTSIRFMSVMPQPCKEKLIVTLLAAGTPQGKIAALLLKQNKLISELRLHCKCLRTCGTAMDLAQIDSSTRIKAYLGRDLIKDAITDTRVIVVCGYGQTKPGQTEDELFEKNAPHVRNAALFASELAYDAIFCIGCQPVNALVPMVSEEFKKAGTYDARKIIGITNLGTIRANSLVGCYTNQDACQVNVPVIGGFCPYSIVAVLSQAKPCGDFPPTLAKNIQAKLARADCDVLELKSTESNEPSIFLSSAFAVSRFIMHLTKAMEGCPTPVEYAFVRQQGDIADFLPYMASVVKLGPEGVISTHMPKLNEEECKLLQNASLAIKNSIQLGSSFVTGEKTRTPKRTPKMPSYCVAMKLDDHSHEFEIADDNLNERPLCPNDMIPKEKPEKKIKCIPQK